MRRARLASLLCVAALGAPDATSGQAPSPQARSPVVTFCAASASLPMSAQHGPRSGYDVEIARALAGAIGGEARFTWLDPAEPALERAVREGRCDVALGVLAEPGPMADGPALDGLALTRPYYRTGYLLIHHPEVAALRTLEAAGNTRIAVEGESIVTFTLRQRGHRVQVFFDHDAVTRAVTDGRADYGYLWGPIAAWTLRRRGDVRIATEFRSPDQWPFALAVRAEDGALRESLDRAILELGRDGTIDRILESYGLPTDPPAAAGP